MERVLADQCGLSVDAVPLDKGICSTRLDSVPESPANMLLRKSNKNCGDGLVTHAEQQSLQ